jgi:hypothetical protein
MEEAQTLSVDLVMLGSLFILPLVGAAAIVAVRLLSSLRPLAPAILVSGLTTSLLTTCYGYTLSTIPIRPHETGTFPWVVLIRSVRIFLYVGFGIDAVTASRLASPTSLIARQLRARRLPPQQPPLGEARSTKPGLHRTA